MIINSYISAIKQQIFASARVFRQEMLTVFSDIGVMTFFFLLPLVYPIIYSLIYNPEVVREIPVAVVDNSRSALSREFIRRADATEGISICGYAANRQEAQRWMAEKKCYALLEIPADYSRKIGRGEQGEISFYCEMSLLIRYRSLSASLADLQIAESVDLRPISLAGLGLAAAESAISAGGNSSGAIENFSIPLGDTQQGFASFVIPGIVILILQQSMILGIVMLAGTRRQRHRFTSQPMAQVVGRTACYVLLFLPLTLYNLHIVIRLFNFPMEGSTVDSLLFVFPMLIASALLGQTLSVLATERESTFLIVVFTSVAFLFLSGLTWPRYAMPKLLLLLGDLLPSTWGIQGFVRINSNGASLADVAHQWRALWLLIPLYFLTALHSARRLSLRPK
jgi:ABC-2 type transport system permease protein